MLDFSEVQRRLNERNCSAPTMTHEHILSPLIGTLLDPEYHRDQPVLLTPFEIVALGSLIQQLAEVIDNREDLLDEAHEALDKADTQLRVSIINVGLAAVGVGLWASLLL